MYTHMLDVRNIHFVIFPIVPTGRMNNIGKGTIYFSDYFFGYF